MNQCFSEYGSASFPSFLCSSIHSPDECVESLGEPRATFAISCITVKQHSCARHFSQSLTLLSSPLTEIFRCDYGFCYNSPSCPQKRPWSLFLAHAAHSLCLGNIFSAVLMFHISVPSSLYLSLSLSFLYIEHCSFFILVWLIFLLIFPSSSSPLLSVLLNLPFGGK